VQELLVWLQVMFHWQSGLPQLVEPEQDLCDITLLEVSGEMPLGDRTLLSKEDLSSIENGN
jgi:hypothetical protein